LEEERVVETQQDMFGYLADLPLSILYLGRGKGSGNTAGYVRLPCRPASDQICILEEERVLVTQQDMFGYLADLPLKNSVSWKRKGWCWEQSRYVRLPCRPASDKFCILEEEREVETH
jgi:hypothetical protein